MRNKTLTAPLVVAMLASISFPAPLQIKIISHFPFLSKLKDECSLDQMEIEK
jgi:hypothetical protein